MKIPVLEVEGFLAVSVQEALEDTTALQLKADLLAHLARTHAKGVVVDVSGIDLVDSFTARLLGEIGRVAHMIGARVVLVGLQPEVAMTMVELGLDLPELATELNMTRGIERLRQETRGTRIPDGAG